MSYYYTVTGDVQLGDNKTATDNVVDRKEFPLSIPFGVQTQAQGWDNVPSDNHISFLFCRITWRDSCGLVQEISTSLCQQLVNFFLLRKYQYKESTQPSNTSNGEHITDKFQIIQILMEQAERLTARGEQKKNLVLESYMKLNEDGQGEQTYSVIPLATIQLIIKSFIYASKTAIHINEQTGCWTWFTGLFKKKPAAPAAPTA